MAADLAAIRRQHKDSECFAPKPGQRKPVQRRKSGHGPGRPFPPGRTSTGGAGDINNSRNHNNERESRYVSVPAYNQAAAPVAPMLPVSPTRPGASADGARPDEVNNLSQKFNEMASNLTSPEPGEIVETPKGPQRQPERQQRPASPDPDEIIVTPRSQRQPAPSPEAFADNWGPKPQRAAANKAQENIKAYEASKNVTLSQGEAEFFRKAAEREERRSRHDTLFVTSDREEHPQDHHINEDEVVPESQPPQPEPVSAASSHTLGRKRPSPEPELSDSAKKQRASNSDFRIRTYEKLGDKGRQQRDELLRKLRLNWGPNWEFVISPELWLTDSKNKTPQHPRNWSATPLEKLIELAELTKKNPQRAAAALREAISRRTASGHGSGRLEKSEDIEIAKEIVSRDKTPRGGRTSIASPQMPRAVPLQPQAGPSTLADVLRTSAASSATLDHQKTPSQRPARRDSGSGGPTISTTRPSVAGATQPIKLENDDNISTSPRSRIYRMKQWTDDELANLDIDSLLNVQKEIVERADQLRGEYRRRRNGEPVRPSDIQLSKLGHEVLVKMISEAVLQQSRAERALAMPFNDMPGGDESNAMILDD